MTISKALLVVVAIIAAYVTSLKPGDILFLVGAAFSLAASAFFPPLVLGVFWKRANKWGAIIGMAAGLGICIYYMMRTYPFFTNMGVPKMDLWFGLSPVSAGMFGLPVGLITIIVVSLLTRRRRRKVQELVEHVRYPHLKGDDLRQRGPLGPAPFQLGKGPPRADLFLSGSRDPVETKIELRKEAAINVAGSLKCTRFVFGLSPKPLSHGS